MSFSSFLWIKINRWHRLTACFLYWMIRNMDVCFCQCCYLCMCDDLEKEARTKHFPRLPEFAKCYRDTNKVLIISTIVIQAHFQSVPTHLPPAFIIAGLEAGWYDGCAAYCLWWDARIMYILLATDWRKSFRTPGKLSVKKREAKPENSRGE